MSQIKPIANAEKEQNHNLSGILPSRCITDCFPKGRLKQTRGLFLESPETFRAYSGDIILFASSKRRRLEARNFAVTFIFIPFTTYEKTSFTE